MEKYKNNHNLKIKNGFPLVVDVASGGLVGILGVGGVLSVPVGLGAAGAGRLLEGRVNLGRSLPLGRSNLEGDPLGSGVVLLLGLGRRDAGLAGPAGGGGLGEPLGEILDLDR